MQSVEAGLCFADCVIESKLANISAQGVGGAFMAIWSGSMSLKYIGVIAN